MSMNKFPSSMTAGAPGVRKLVIKPFKIQPKLPENFFDETWQKLRTALQAVYHKNASVISKEELYRAVEDLCVQKFAVQLYEKLSAEIEIVACQQVQLLREAASLDPVHFLQQVETVWGDHCAQLSTVRNIFLYLDRSYALTSAQRGVTELGHFYFRRELESEQSTYTNIINNVDDVNSTTNGGLVCRVSVATLCLLQNMRLGDMTNRDTVGQVCRMLATLQLYPTRFEPLLVADTRMFLRREGLTQVAQKSVSEFCLLIDQRISETLDWTFRFLDVSSRKVLLQVIEEELLIPHVQFLLDGFGNLVDALSLQDLKRLARLLAQVHKTELVRLQFLNYIKSNGAKLVQNLTNNNNNNNNNSGSNKDKENKESRFIEDVLDFQERMEKIVEEALRPTYYLSHNSNNTHNTTTSNNNSNSITATSSHTSTSTSSSTSTNTLIANNANTNTNNDVFRSALKSGFEYFLNISPRFIAEQLARHCDRLLKGEKRVSDTETELLLNRSIIVFKYLSEQDVFEAFYKKLLAKRLLLEKSASNDLERAMLSKLKAECGAQFTSKLEGMFSDLDLSTQCLAHFRTYLETNSNTNNNNTNNNSNGTQNSQSIQEASSQYSGSLGSGEAFQLWLLTQGHWPHTQNTQDETVTLTPELKFWQSRFVTFYEAHFQGRRLLWSHALSRAVVSVTFLHPNNSNNNNNYNNSITSNVNSIAKSTSSSTNSKSKVYDLDVTLYQALTLSCFNQNNTNTNSINPDNSSGNTMRLTVSQVSQLTNLSTEDVTLCLLSFAAPLNKSTASSTSASTATSSSRLLLRHTDQESQTLSFSVNPAFESRLRRMKVPLPLSVRDASTGQALANTSTNNNTHNSSSNSETQQTLEEVFRERAYQCDAAIVRIMKARKRLAHAQLMAEVMQQLKFPAQNSDIKKRIEALIERDYLERDSEDNTFYKYLA